MVGGHQSKDVHYAPLTDLSLTTPESDDTLQTPRRNPTASRFLYTTIALISTLITFALFMAVTSTKVHLPAVTHCGDSAATAQQLGCHFDIMSFSWLPPACFDADLTKEFEGMQQWKWYADPESTQLVAKEEVLLGQRDALYVSFGYHRAHYTAMWKKLHRALGSRGFVDSYIGSYNHTAHCGHMLLMEGDELGVVNTIISTKFPRCVSKTVELHKF